MSAPRFEFYEKVRVIATDPAKAQILGQLGAILGKSQNDHGVWSYAVSIYRDGICWSCYESEPERGDAIRIISARRVTRRERRTYEEEN